MSSVGRSRGKIVAGKSKGEAATAQSSLVLSIADIQQLLGVGRGSAYALARKVGKRIGGARGRLVVSRAAVEAWLAGDGGAR